MRRIFAGHGLSSSGLLLVMFCALFVILLVGPVQARAGRVRRVAVLAFAPPFLEAYKGLREGLEAHAYNLDKDLIFEVHSLDRDLTKVAPLIERFVADRYDLIFSITTPVTQAVQAAMLVEGADIPVVFTAVADPLGSKVVSDLRHPSGNFTGVSHISIELLPQRLLLFKKAFPYLKKVALFFNPEEEISKRSFEHGYLRQAANDAGVVLQVNHVKSHDDMILSCRNFKPSQADALFMLPDPLSVAHFKELLELSHRFKIPLMVIDNMLLQNGGVIGYSPGFYGVGFQSANIIDQIFKGVAPTQIAVQNPDQVKLVVSVKEVLLLGLKISNDILLQADEVLR